MTFEGLGTDYHGWMRESDGKCEAKWERMRKGHIKHGYVSHILIWFTFKSEIRSYSKGLSREGWLDLFCDFKRYIELVKRLLVVELVAQLCQTLFCNPMDYSVPGSSVHGILQARMLEWIAISYSRVSSPPRYWIWVSHVVGRFFTIWATREAINRRLLE